eukprot:RCo041940
MELPSSPEARRSGVGTPHAILFKSVSGSGLAVPFAPHASPRRPTSEGLTSDLWKVVSESYLNILLLAVPLAVVAVAMEASPTTVFGLSFMSLIPLAAMLGTFTEDLALRSNETIGALLNATFGNATELIISIFALKGGMNSVIQNSLIGSILGNMLLVLGCALFAAGVKHGFLDFTQDKNQLGLYSGLLLLSSVALVIPTMHSLLPSSTSEATLRLSRQTAVVMLTLYLLYLIFQLFFAQRYFEQSARFEKEITQIRRVDSVVEAPRFSTTFAVVALGTTTVLISLMSEYLVGTLEPAANALGLTSAFISVILLPIVGNAAEHATAILMAMEDPPRLEIAIGVAIGSSIQIALMVIPALVVVSWIIGHNLDLNFQPFNVVVMFVSVMVVNNTVCDGSSHWLEGLFLLVLYVMLALSYLNTSDIPPPVKDLLDTIQHARNKGFPSFGSP